MIAHRLRRALLWTTLALLFAAAAAAQGTGHPLAYPPCAAGIYACDTWGAGPPGTRCLFDIHFGIGGGGPTEEMRQAVLRAGGRIVHEFNLPTIRAQMCSADVVAMRPYWVQTVGDPAVYDIDGFVGFRDSITADDEAFLAAQGVRIIRRFTFIDAVHAWIPDASVPAIRAREDVRYVEENGILCLIDSPRPFETRSERLAPAARP